MAAPTPASGMRPGIQNYQNYQTFINLYNEIAKKVLTYHDKRAELVKILQEAIPITHQKKQDFQVTGTQEQRRRITKEDLLNIYAEKPKTMNPFSFFALFNAYIRRGGLYGNWSAWMRGLVCQLKIDADIPDAEGLPINVHHGELFHPGNPPEYFSVLDGWLQTYYVLMPEEVVERLWRLAKYATYKLPPEPRTNDSDARQFIDDFNDVAPRLKEMNSGLMSAGLNWMNPGVWVRANYTNYNAYYSEALIRA